MADTAVAEDESTGTTTRGRRRRGGRRYRHLTNYQSFLAGNYLAAHAEAFQRDRPMFAEVASAIEKDLGFPCSPSSIMRMAEEMKILWEERLPTPAIPEAIPEAMREDGGLDEEMAVLVVMIEEIRVSLAHLYQHLAIPTPTPLSMSIQARLLAARPA